MSTTNTDTKAKSRNVAVLVTGLYDDAATVDAAIESSQIESNCTKITLHPENMTDDNWDDVVKLVLSVSKVITV